ncbi:hypothetical protein O3P69_001254 [Scylla paramamosain]|uniref:Helicase ATP-binding domain-containing protein n=1 Tax=Scylla paramamosain TaxID=85552 RepID=A0AAW0UPS3_SCYPA
MKSYAMTCSLKHYQYLCVDEGHTLKNHKSLNTFPPMNWLLFTGTPLQNSLAELWALLNFLMLDNFESLSNVSEMQEGSEERTLRQEWEGQAISTLMKIRERECGCVWECFGGFGTPVPCIHELIDELQNYSIVQVAAGDQHSLALTSWGLIYARGDNGYGQLGVNSCDSHTATPKLVKSLARKVTMQLACGANHTLALTADGELYTKYLRPVGT